MDFEKVAPPVQSVPHSLSVVDFGADPTGRLESSNAFDAAIAAAKARRQDGLHPGRHLPGEPPHRGGQRDDRGCGQLVDDHSRPPGHAVLAASGRLDSHGRRLLRKVRRRRWRKSQRSSVELRDRRRCPRPRGHRPGERHRRRAQRLVDRRALHPTHEGGALVRRTDAQPDGQQHDRGGRDRRRHQLSSRRDQLESRQLVLPQHRR